MLLNIDDPYSVDGLYYDDCMRISCRPLHNVMKLRLLELVAE
jgi:hypothetical protein